MMAKKKHFTEGVDFIKDGILAFYVAGILLGVDAIRFFVGLFFNPLSINDIMEYLVPWSVGIVVIGLLINRFSKNIKS
jgi:hypothetical protein